MSLRLTAQERDKMIERSEREIFGSYAHALRPATDSQARG